MVCKIPGAKLPELVFPDTPSETEKESEKPIDGRNGRVPEIQDTEFSIQFPVGGFSKVSDVQPMYRDNPVITSTQLKSDTRSAFFSRANIDLIHKQIQGIIYKRTGFQIDRQSDDDLHIIMNWVFQAYAHHTGSDEVGRLNGIVMQEVIPMILSNMRMYAAYLRDASTMHRPLPLPHFDSIRGENVPEFQSYF